MKRLRRLKRRGATLVLVTTIGVIVAILGMSMIQLGYDARILAVRDVEKVSARCAADAGLAEAFLRMQQQLIRAHENHQIWSGPIAGSTGTLAGTNNAQYSYNVTTNAFGQYQIDSTGTTGLATKTVHGTVDVTSYWEGIGVNETVDAKNGTYFGVVGPGSSNDLKIRSNSTVDNAMMFKAYVNVSGDVYCGPNGDPDSAIDVKSTTIIQGQTGAATDLMVWPPVAMPGGLTVGPPITGPNTLPQGRYGYIGGSSNLTIPNGALIQIAPDLLHVPPQPTVLYVADTLRLTNGAEIRVLAGAMLEVYVGIALESSEGTGFGNQNNLAATLKIFGLPTCTTINLKTKSDTFASVYAPNADLQLFNSGNFYGAIIANSFGMKNSGNFYFDSNLETVSIDDLLAEFVITRWWED